MEAGAFRKVPSKMTGGVMDKKEFKYEIGGKTYIQRPLVLGQIRQLTAVLRETPVSIFLDEMEMARLLINNAGLAIAVVITEEGTKPQDKDVEQLAKDLEFTMDAETMAQVVQDFFVCNPVVSIYGRVSEMVKAIQTIPAAGSTRPVSSSPEETSQGATGSSGGSPQESASPGSNTAPGT